MTSAGSSISAIAAPLGVLLGLAWFLPGLGLWAFQDRIIFPLAYEGAEATETALDANLAASRGAVLRRLTAADGTHVLSWHYAGGGKGTVLYVGGNAEHVTASTGLARALAEQGWDLFVLVPRGYPGSEGRPSEPGFALDVRAAWAYLTGPLHQPPSSIVLHGRSLGGGAIGLLLEEVKPGGVVLESTFDALTAVAEERFPVYPVSWLLRTRFDTASRARAVTAPVLVVHSRTDEVVPFDRGDALARAFSEATFVAAQSGSHASSLILSHAEARAAWVALLASVAQRSDGVGFP